MPNTVRGGGVSRKIEKIEDRRRLKNIIDEMKMPEGMAIIIRTAGSDRTKNELNKDFDYLQNLWNVIRDKTLQSTAPMLINEEGNLIKRTIRDLYTNDVGELIIAGENAFNAGKDYIKLMVPTHLKKVKLYRDSKISLFQKYNVEKQLDLMHLPTVNLKSGGYIVINQTEALVAIDVNSGRATKERNIEETALKTNLEAAEELARQLKLRDLSGLIVVDFIDMEIYRNQHSIEKKLKESMSFDRAKIQIGRISHFGLLELSRQRLRPSVSENYFSPCKNCSGTGVIRSVESSALRVLRRIEETNFKNHIISVFVQSSISYYILNFKRSAVYEIEKKYNLNIIFETDDTISDIDCLIEKKGKLTSEINNKKDDENDTLININDNEDENNDEDEFKKRRRRGKRGGKGRKRPEKNKDNINLDLDEKENNFTETDKSQKNNQKSDIFTITQEGKTKIKPSEITKRKQTTNKKVSLKKPVNKKNIAKNSVNKNGKDLNTADTIDSKSTKNEPKKTLKKTSSKAKDKLDTPNESKSSKKIVSDRKSKSSEPLKVVDVDDNSKKKRRGWWAKNEPKQN